MLNVEILCTASMFCCLPLHRIEFAFHFNPISQSQVKDPSVLVQAPLLLHVWVPVRHSSTSSKGDEINEISDIGIKNIYLSVHAFHGSYSIW